MSDLSSLDDLFAEARARITVARKAEKAAVIRHTAEPEKVSVQALYLDPKNWQRTRGVALIHEETETVLGNFSEYVHISVAECRKLVRESAPISVEAIERVSGSWWLGAERRPEPRKDWHEVRTAILHLHLSELRVHAPLCEVVAHLSYGSLARVELAIDTTLAQEEGGEQLLMLPKGTNVLEVMSLDSKMHLWKELAT
jgi:hypothetical protein